MMVSIIENKISYRKKDPYGIKDILWEKISAKI